MKVKPEQHSFYVAYSVQLEGSKSIEEIALSIFSDLYEAHNANREDIATAIVDNYEYSFRTKEEDNIISIAFSGDCLSQDDLLEINTHKDLIKRSRLLSQYINDNYDFLLAESSKVDSNPIEDYFEGIL